MLCVFAPKIDNGNPPSPDRRDEVGALKKHKQLSYDHLILQKNRSGIMETKLATFVLLTLSICFAQQDLTVTTSYGM